MNKWLSSTVDTYLKYFDAPHEPVVYEVGSRDGNDGVELAKRIYKPVYHDNLWHDGKIVLFECNPPQQEVIKRNYPYATLITEAISDKAGEVEFLQIHGDNNMVGSSTMNTKRSDKWIKETSTIKVKTRRLDDVIKELKHTKTEIDIMKIDTEGYTAEVLRSLGKYLRNVRVFQVETEITGYARAETNLDIALFMGENGYKLVDIFYEWPPQIEDHVYVRIGDV